MSRGVPAAGITTETASLLSSGSFPNRVLGSGLVSDLVFDMVRGSGSDLNSALVCAKFNVLRSASCKDWGSESTKVLDEVCVKHVEPDLQTSDKVEEPVAEPREKAGEPGEECSEYGKSIFGNSIRQRE